MSNQKSAHALMSRSDELLQHWQRLGAHSIRDLFSNYPARFDTMSLQVADVLFDFSKTHLDAAALDALINLAKDADVEGKRNAMFSGEHINTTENRAVLHTALRAPSDATIVVDGANVIPDVQAVLSRMADFSDQVRSGDYKPSGKPITDIVNIGIGGSDLGPNMVTTALSPYSDGPSTHFVSNVDGADIADTLSKLAPETTLFVIASKTFTTQETMANAETAMKWVQAVVGEQAGAHFCALSTNLEATQAFGIAEERTFGFWDWVGGRYSVWSAIGLPVMMAIGADAFHDFLGGARLADEHFKKAPLAKNIPVLMALIGVWHRNICGFSSHALLPYDNRLSNFARWLQQLDMESNGKSRTLDGQAVTLRTGPVIFGDPGTNGQHAFYQLLHQGTDVIPCDFLIAAKGHEPELEHQHMLLVANCLAQSEALMKGQTLEEADGNPHRIFAGNRPSCTFMYPKLDPRTLGFLMALYEHKIFVQGVLWNVNSFDQFGVELGKKLGKGIEVLIEEEAPEKAGDASTQGLLNYMFEKRNS